MTGSRGLLTFTLFLFGAVHLQGFAAAEFSISTEGDFERADAIAGCFTTRNCLIARRTTWDHLVGDLASCITVTRVWWSKRSSKIPVALVTQLSIARLDQLRAQCAAWQGPLAAAVYLPLVNPESELTLENRKFLNRAISNCAELFRATEAPGATGCQLRILLMYELFTDIHTATMLYPVNSLRNYARLLADTNLITNIDVDLLPSTSISIALSDPAVLRSYTEGCRIGGVFVWPAFQTNCNGTVLAEAIAGSGRQALKQELQKPDQCVTMFEYKYAQFHAPTNYSRWLSTEGQVYQVRYSYPYEPWFLSWRWTTSWFDFRYRGYGYNKCVQVAAMNATGATWFVSPHGFIIHRPHHPTKMRKDFVHVLIHNLTVPNLRRTMYGHVFDLWQAAQADLRTTGRLEVRVEDSFRECLGRLPWWRSAGG